MNMPSAGNKEPWVLVFPLQIVLYCNSKLGWGPRELSSHPLIAFSLPSPSPRANAIVALGDQLQLHLILVENKKLQYILGLTVGLASQFWQTLSRVSEKCLPIRLADLEDAQSLVPTRWHKETHSENPTFAAISWLFWCMYPKSGSFLFSDIPGNWVPIKHKWNPSTGKLTGKVSAFQRWEKDCFSRVSVHTVQSSTYSYILAKETFGPEALQKKSRH